MDPDKALDDMQKAVAAWEMAPAQSDADSLADEMAEKFNILDEWLQRGGFLPAAWSRGR